jgi:DNA-binding transcriptional MerR regulator
MVNKKYTTIQRIKRLENIVSQIYMSVEVIKKQLDENNKPNKNAATKSIRKKNN